MQFYTRVLVYFLSYHFSLKILYADNIVFVVHGESHETNNR